MPTDSTLRALALVCRLKPAPEPSSSVLMARQILDALGAHGAEQELLRVADLDARPGVEKDMGDGDQWPQIRERILARRTGRSAQR
jgi:multimeric flavodoxin WrbA